LGFRGLGSGFLTRNIIGIQGFGLRVSGELEGFHQSPNHSVDYEGFPPPNLEGDVTKFAPHEALKSIARRKVAF
jgi:hypothetical protein